MTTNTKMTVYNKYTDKVNKTVVFYKHTLDNVFWDDSKGINLNKGYDNADSVNVFIPKYKNDMSEYKKPKQYIGGKGWTLREGDFIVKGETDLKQVSRISELTDLYNDVFTITMVDDKDFGSKDMQHFEIRGN